MSKYCFLCVVYVWVRTCFGIFFIFFGAFFFFGLWALCLLTFQLTWCGWVVVVFLWWCFCGGVCVVMFLWWCGWVAFLWWCGGVFVFLWWCFGGGVFVSPFQFTGFTGDA